MQKRFIQAIAIALALAVAAAVVGCAAPKAMKLRDFKGLESLPDAPQKIFLHYEDAHFGEFEITDKEKIAAVVDILLNGSYVRSVRSSELGAGGNGYMIVTAEGGESFRVSLHKLEHKGYWYTPESDTLMQELYKIGNEYGALAPM